MILLGTLIFIIIFIFSWMIINKIVQSNLEKQELKAEYRR